MTDLFAKKDVQDAVFRVPAAQRLRILQKKIYISCGKCKRIICKQKKNNCVKKWDLSKQHFVKMFNPCQYFTT